MLIKVQKRDLLGKKVKHLRKDDMIPASVYGPKRKPESVMINRKDFNTAFKKVGYSKLFELQLGEGTANKVLIKDVQTDPLKDIVLNVSFYEVDMTKPITADVPVVVVGESPAVKINVGLLVTPFEKVNVHCLPADLPSELSIDVSNLEKIGDSILISALTLPKGVTISANMATDSLLAYISAPQKQIVEEVAVEEEAVVEGEEGAEEGEGKAGVKPAEGAKGKE